MKKGREIMQAIILAAGYGSRLRPLTDSMPKCLTEINGKPLLVNALEILADHNITETIIVLGHMREKIIEQIGFQWNGMKITYVENTQYRNTNNVYSLYLTKDYIYEDVILLECDLFYQADLIETILNSKHDCNILVSPFNPETMDGSIVKVGNNGAVTELILGKRQQEGMDYSNTLKTVNVYKFSSDFFRNKYMPAIELYINTQQMKSYYELVLGALIYFGNDDIQVVKIDESRWAEVDDVEDLRRAEIKFGYTNCV